MISNHEIGVIIPTYNRCDLLLYTLESLKRQLAEKKKFAVVIADDGSSDGTREMARTFEKDFNLIYVFQQDEGYRPASARNLGIKAVESKICLFVDAGILLDENCIERHLNFHRQAKDRVAIGYIYGTKETPTTLASLKNLVNPFEAGSSIKKLASNPIFHDTREQQYKRYNDRLEDLPAPWIYFWAGHVSVPKEKLMNVGCFDENYNGKWGVEDNDLGYRLYNNGVTFSLLREATSVHYPQDHEYGDNVRKLQEGYENCTYFHNKFKSIQTKLFLDYFRDTSFADINELCNNCSPDQRKPDC
jgi:glycosyltransferase involved in cell wall biosynthesis